MCIHENQYVESVVCNENQCPVVETPSGTPSSGTNAGTGGNAPVNCVGNWSDFGECSAECDGGTKSRTYTISVPASNGGLACSRPDQEVQEEVCNINPCDPGPLDCIANWSEYGECSAECAYAHLTIPTKLSV